MYKAITNGFYLRDRHPCVYKHSDPGREKIYLGTWLRNWNKLIPLGKIKGVNEVLFFFFGRRWHTCRSLMELSALTLLPWKENNVQNYRWVLKKCSHYLTLSLYVPLENSESWYEIFSYVVKLTSVKTNVERIVTSRWFLITWEWLSRGYFYFTSAVNIVYYFKTYVLLFKILERCSWI